MIPKENPGKLDFEKFYEEVDPWRVNQNIVTEIIVMKLKKYFANQNFQKGLDLGCGEAAITSRLDFANEWTGVDISENAINRAQAKYPSIKFQVMDINDLSKLQNKFNIILCLETLYYLSPAQQKQFLQKMKGLGDSETRYCISLVVSGPSKYRDHVSYEEAINNLSPFFLIEKAIPISVKDLPLGRKTRWIFKIEKFVPLILFRKRLYVKHLKTIDLKSAHQVMFMLRNLQ